MYRYLILALIIVAAILGFIASKVFRRTWARFLSWGFISLILPVLVVGPQHLSFTAHGEDGLIWAVFWIVFVISSFASGVALLIGCSLKAKS